MKQRSIALLLALVLLAGVLPVPAAAAAPAKKLAAITFDDGPGPYTDGLLDELAQRGVVVTFFMQGFNASRYPSVVKKAYEAGHQIASHTYNHPQLTALSSQGIQDQLTTTAAILNEATGANHSYMVRPPYGSTNPRVLSALNAPAVLWSVDTRDWESRNADAIYRHIVNDTRDGSIILMHDIHPATIPGALRGIDALLEQGYELVTVSELLRRRGCDAAPGTRHYSAAGDATLPGISLPVITANETEQGRYVVLTADAGTTIYYTTDGSAPTSRSAVYTGPFQLETAATVKAFAAYSLNGGRSRVAELTLDPPRLNPPVITPQDGCAVITAEGEVYYTLDGSMPTAASERYTGPVPLPAGTVIRAIAVQPGRRDSLSSSLLHSDLGNLFSDVQPTDWYYRDVDAVLAQSLMATQAQAFFPERPLTRRELVVVLHRVAGKPEAAGTYAFPDVTGEDPSYAAIAWAVEGRIFTGFADGTLRPDATLTREQLAAVLFRMQGEPQTDGAIQSSLSPFADRESVPDYAREAMGWAVSSGLLNGVSAEMLAPEGTVTRAQLASIVLRLKAL